MTATYSRQGAVAVITIERLESRNAVDAACAVALRRAWEKFAADEGAHVAVLTGAGGHFSAGADLKAFDLTDHPSGFLGFTRTVSPKPTIAAVEGYCVAGGLEMALWCDLRVAGASAIFGCFERRFGVPLVDGGTQRLPRIVGVGRALEMVLTGRPVDASEAYAIGLVNRVVSDGEAMVSAVALAKEIGAFPQTTLRSDRLAMLEGLNIDLELERRHGLASLGEAADVVRFREGEGRGGSPIGS